MWLNDPHGPTAHPTGPNRGRLTARNRENTTVQPCPSPRPLGRRLDFSRRGRGRMPETHQNLRRTACRSVPEGRCRMCRPAGRGRAGRWPGSSTGTLRGYMGPASACGAVPGPRPPPPAAPGDALAPGRAACGGTGAVPWKGPRRRQAGPGQDPVEVARASSDCGSEGGAGDWGGDGDAASGVAGRGPLPALGTHWGLFTPVCPLTHASCYEALTL